jgi:hypothetical protein
MGLTSLGAISDTAVPFDGMKQSGFGREGSVLGSAARSRLLRLRLRLVEMREAEAPPGAASSTAPLLLYIGS